MIAFLSSPDFVFHDTGPHHPERPDRIRAVYRALFQSRLIASDPFSGFQIDLGQLPPFERPLLELSFGPANPQWINLVHSPGYAERIAHVCASGGGVLDQGDTLVSAKSCDTAMLGLGAVLRGCDAVIHGEASRAFCAIRPPGHHAEPGRPMGFCLFSNVAIGARYLQKAHGLERIAIVDFDVHHGNGTQAAFEDDPSVLFISLHQHPRTCYPGSGYEWEMGVGPGRGFTLNLPFNPGADDEAYLQAIHGKVLPKLEEFGPQAMMISAGFDAHQADPLANINLTEHGFEEMTAALAQAAERLCAGRVISVLEGGYDLRALGRSVVRHLGGLGAR